MVIIPNYLSVCLSPGFPLARSPGHRPPGPSGLLACFLLLLLSQCVNELSVPRPPQGSRPGFRLAPSRPPGRPGRPLFPFGGAKVHLFFEPPNFFAKIFRNFQKTASRPSFTSVLHPYKRNAPQYAITKQNNSYTNTCHLSHQSELHDWHQNAFHRWHRPLITPETLMPKAA